MAQRVEAEGGARGARGRVTDGVAAERGTRPPERAPLAQDELIGLRAKVVASGDPGLVGLEGRVVDETQRTFVLETARGERTVPKRGQGFQFTRPDGSTETLPGEALAHRPDERTKKAARGGRARATKGAAGEAATRHDSRSPR